MEAQPQEFVYVTETGKSFQEAVVAVRKTAESHKWGVLGDYDFSEILASKGFSQDEEVKAIDICAPSHADALMGVERLTGLCMPCSVLVFTEGGKTKMAAMSPGAVMPQLFPDAATKVRDQLDEITQQVRTIITEAAG